MESRGGGSRHDPNDRLADGSRHDPNDRLADGSRHNPHNGLADGSRHNPHNGLAEDRLSRIVYISVPEVFSGSIGGFALDPSISIPVELPPGVETWNTSSLTWEAMVAGMLKVLGFDRENERAEYYRRFVKAVKPELYSELMETGIFKAKNRDFAIADEIFTVLDGLYPDDGLILLNSALVYEAWATACGERGNEEAVEALNDKAHAAYKRALECPAPPPEAFLNAGYFYVKNGNFEKARSSFRNFIEIGSDKRKLANARKAIEEIESRNLLDTLFKEAYDFIKLGREEEGIAKIESFLERNAGVWNAWFLLGWANRRLGRHERGRDAFLKAVELGSDEVDTYNELAICLMETGDIAACRKWLAEALKKEPENVKIISNLGIAALKEGKREEALSYFGAALEIDGNDEIARRYLTFLKN